MKTLMLERISEDGFISLLQLIKCMSVQVHFSLFRFNLALFLGLYFRRGQLVSSHLLFAPNASPKHVVTSKIPRRPGKKAVQFRAVFTLSVESNSRMLWFYITMLSDWFKTLAPLFQPIKSKTKTNRDSLAHVFPRLVPATCICFEF